MLLQLETITVFTNGIKESENPFSSQIWSLSVMDSQYHQFESSNNSSVRGEQKLTIQKGKIYTCHLILFNNFKCHLKLWKNPSGNIYRYEEASGFCPLWLPGAAAVNSAAGNWDKMYDSPVKLARFIDFTWFILSYNIFSFLKVSHLNKEITDVKLHLERISHRIPSSSSSGNI